MFLIVIEIYKLRVQVWHKCFIMLLVIIIIVNNFQGYFLSPIISGAIMDSFHDKDTGMIWGLTILNILIIIYLRFRINLYTGLLCFLFLGLAAYSYKEFK